MEQEETYVGDVAKAQVDVAIRPADQRVSRDAGSAGLPATLEPVMVLLEAAAWNAVGGRGSRRCGGRVNPRRCETSPGPPGSWPRPTLWTQRS